MRNRDHLDLGSRIREERRRQEEAVVDRTQWQICRHFDLIEHSLFPPLPRLGARRLRPERDPDALRRPEVHRELIVGLQRMFEVLRREPGR
jgi:hypothetical protein